MLKYERFVVKMSLEQKLRLITSSEFYKSSSVGEYDIPVFEIKNRPYGEDCKGLHITHFPCDAALACSWNGELTEEVYAAIGQESHAVNSFAYFNCSNDLQAEGITSDYFLLGEFLRNKVAGLRRGNGYVNFEDVVSEEEDAALSRKEVRDAVVCYGKPDSVVISDIEEAETLKKRFKYGDKIFGVVSTVEEALDFLYSGASFLFLAEDIFDALLNKLKSLTSAYKSAHNKYVNDKISESSFARLVRSFRIFNVDIIDKACDDVIDIVYTMKSAKENPVSDFKSLKKGESATFDEINHNDLAATAARQSAVLLKNDGGILPISRNVRLAVIGEYAKDVKYQREYYYTRATGEKIAFDAINDYELNTVGFALGYAKGERGRGDLIDHAVSLCAKADVVLLYLAAAKGEDRLPPEQLELLDIIAGKGAKIIAVVASEGDIDMSFADKCAAVLMTFVAGQGGTIAALDILTGLTCPSGKLAFPVGAVAGGTARYPLGYGLSYTSFTYDNLKVNETGLSFTVKNTGDRDGFAVPLFFVKKKNTTTAFMNKTLKGFKKVFVPAGDGVRVRIPFDENTFSVFTPEKGYFVEGGLYTVSVGESADTDTLSGMLLLKNYERKATFASEVVETSDDGRALDFTERDLPNDVKETRKRLPFGLKLGLAIMLAVYVDAVLALFAFGNVIADKNFVFYLVLAAVAVIVNGLIIGYICILSTQRKRQKYIHPNAVLTDMLDNVDEFTEIAKVKYRQPVAEEQKVEEAPEVTEEEVVAEEMAAAYEVRFDDVSSSDVALSEHTSFAELCSNFKDFAAKRGINIEATSARVLVSAIAASKLVFLTSKNVELLPDFVKILNDYFGNESVITASDEWKGLADILWNEGDGKYVLSPFSNAVHAAYASRERECVLIIDNVNLNNLGSYFFNFLEYANHPTEKYVISFNEETSFELPDNLTYILVPQNGSLDLIPTEILNAALVAEVMLSKADTAPEQTVEPKVLSHEDFKLLLSDTKEVSFIPERVWKKVDQLVEAINASERFSIGNKNIIQMESFTSALIDGGADEPEAVTNMFLAKLGYILKNTRSYRKDGGEKTVFAIVEKLFPDEELTKIKRVLTKSAQTKQAAAAASERTAATNENGENSARLDERSSNEAQKPVENAEKPAENAGESPNGLNSTKNSENSAGLDERSAYQAQKTAENASNAPSDGVNSAKNGEKNAGLNERSSNEAQKPTDNAAGTPSTESKTNAEQAAGKPTADGGQE